MREYFPTPSTFFVCSLNYVLGMMAASELNLTYIL